MQGTGFSVPRGVEQLACQRCNLLKSGGLPSIRAERVVCLLHGCGEPFYTRAFTHARVYPRVSHRDTMIGRNMVGRNRSLPLRTVGLARTPRGAP